MAKFERRRVVHKPWKTCREFKNSKEIIQIMKSQNKITQNALSLTRDASKLLENSHKNKEILHYSL